jgi:hypothetical protein
VGFLPAFHPEFIATATQGQDGTTTLQLAVPPGKLQFRQDVPIDEAFGEPREPDPDRVVREVVLDAQQAGSLWADAARAAAEGGSCDVNGVDGMIITIRHRLGGAGVAQLTSWSPEPAAPEYALVDRLLRLAQQTGDGWISAIAGQAVGYVI